MEMEARIRLFAQLGKDIRRVCEQWNGNVESLPTVWKDVVYKTQDENAWFTPENQLAALRGIAEMLNESDMREALAPYASVFEKTPEKTIAVIMAGNIPAVNFLDFMCVVLAGYKFVGKLSSADAYWLPFLASELTEIEPRLKPYISFEKDAIRQPFDAVIATGSNNTARYFEYYFGRYPHVIRKNRSSVAVLTGNETDSELLDLGKDIFTFFGMGCRNVSKLYVPRNFDFVRLMQQMETFLPLRDNHKYANNYEYHRSIFLLNGDHFYDNNVLLLRENHALAAPVGTAFYEFYDSIDELSAQLWRSETDIQCTVHNGEKRFPRQVETGNTQCPKLDDYPDGINIFAFLAGLA